MFSFVRVHYRGLRCVVGVLNDFESTKANVTEMMKTLDIFYHQYFPDPAPWEHPSALRAKGQEEED